MRPKRVLIVDDHQVIRVGVCQILAGNPRWEVVGEAENGRQAIEQTIKLKPDIVILDISMPEMNGYQALPHIRHAAPGCKIVIFSMHEMPLSAKEFGADAFVAKSRAATDLASTLEVISPHSNSATA